ncbi:MULTISPECIES: hypothetical protein [unclassified Mycobacterium]|uniref:hypothetical protein n=1 Tax=unclassified Mycobacterium TaxID=2642494 RepID=UPI0029C85CA9|nr:MULTISPECIES: hypothetical protein [unclassified Mycobacterium]
MNHVLRTGVLGDLPLRDFIVSPGFAGVAALLAAIIASCAVLYGVRRAGKRSQQLLEQRERDLEQTRGDAQNALAVARCWERWQWVVETAGIEPAVSEGATLGLGPAVTLELLRGLLRDAEQLGDDTLAKAVVVYQEQLLLVLAQQGGPVAELAVATTVQSPDGQLDDKPASSAHRKPDTATPTTAGETSSATVKDSGGGRRRR